MDIKRFLIMTLTVIATGIMIGIGGLILFGVLIGALVLGFLGLTVILLTMSPEQRALWFARMKSNLKGWAHKKTSKAHKNERLR